MSLLRDVAWMTLGLSLLAGVVIGGQAVRDHILTQPFVEAERAEQERARAAAACFEARQRGCWEIIKEGGR